MPSQGSYRDALLRVIDEVGASGAASAGASGEFPRAQVDALGAAGMLGLTVPEEFGGGAAFRKESVVERLFRDSRAARDGTRDRRPA